MRQILTLSFLVLLSACTYTDYEFYPPNTDIGRLCVTQCQQTRQLCINEALSRERKCRQHEDILAQVKYQNYLQEIKIQNRALPPGAKAVLPTKTASSFANYNQCSANTCDCETKYRNCYRGCGGRVKEVVRDMF